MEKKMMEEVSCLICDNNTYSIRFAEVHNRLNTSEKFQIVRCNECGFSFLNPRPKEEYIDRYYDLEEYQPHKLSDKSFADKIYKYVRSVNIRNKRKLVEAHCEKGKLLDIGCGTGEFIEYMNDNDWSVMGLETATEAREYAQNLGFKIAAEPSEIKVTFNVITLWHVLEHVHRVGDLFKQISGLLAQNGKIFIAVPNINSSDSEIYKSSWVALDVPRHLYHFRMMDMKKLLENFGFKIDLVSSRLIFDTWYNVLLSEKLAADIKKKEYNMFSMGLNAVSSFAAGILDINKFSSPVYVASRV